MYYLILASLALLTIFLYLVIELKKSVHLLYVIPMFVFFVMGSYFYIDSFLGYPTTKTDEKQFLLLSYYVPVEEDRIYVWVLLKDEEEPKALILPYKQDDHESLNKASDKIANGSTFMGVFAEEEQLGEEDAQGVEEGENNQGAGGGTLKSWGGSLSLFELTPEYYLPPKNVE